MCARGAADEDSGGAVLFLLKAPVLYHQAERSITRPPQRREGGTMERGTQDYFVMKGLQHMLVVSSVFRQWLRGQRSKKIIQCS